MPFSQPRQGFRNYYERSGSGTPVVLVHGNPGDHMEFSRVVPLLGDNVDVFTPDLRGYGKSDKHLEDVGNAYSLTGQVDGVIALIDELGVSNAVLCGYDVGSFTAQTIAMKRPDLAHSLVIAPPTLGVGRRSLEEKAVNAFLHAILYVRWVSPVLRCRRTGSVPRLRELGRTRRRSAGQVTNNGVMVELCAVGAAQHPVIVPPGRELR